MVKFQSTHPRGVRLIIKLRFLNLLQFQSTHPRGVRRRKQNRQRLKSSFNPRTHEGCDFTLRFSVIALNSFNPRTHEGCDRSRSPPTPSKRVSIHAPTRGATSYLRSIRSNSCFNPRTHEGCDPVKRERPRFRLGFNPRTHEGCDINTDNDTISVRRFNPRTHEGCDWQLLR